MTRVIVAPVVRRELIEIGAFIEADSPNRAASFIMELEEKTRSLVHFPRKYRLREDIAPGIRLATHGRYAILFRYRVDDDAVDVLHIVDGTRDLRRLFGR